MAQSKARYLSSLLTTSGFVKDDRSQLAGSDGTIDVINLPTIPNSSLENSTTTINGTSISLGDSNSFTTDAFSEGNNNLYYTSVRTDSDAKNAISGGTGITYNASTGIIEVTATGVTAGTYGSATLVPVVTVDSQGQVTSITTATAATLDSFGYNPTNAKLTITASDTTTYEADVTLAPFSTADLQETTNLYYTQSRVDSAFDARLAQKNTGDISEGSNLYYTTNRFDSDFSDKSTTNLSEGTNLYYTDARFDSAFGTKTTTNVAEGTNLYYTDTRFDTRLATKTTSDISEGTNLYYTNGRFDSDFGLKTTNSLSEGNTNLYFTDTRARNAIGAQQNGGDGTFSYDSASGRFTFIGPSATEVRAHLVQGTGLTYDSASGVYSITASGVTSGTYGGDSSVVQLSINAQGQIDSAKAITLNTSNMTEGTNLFYTDTRARNALNVGGDLTYDSSTGQLTFTERTDAEVRNLLSVSGDLTYDSATGQFSFTERTDAEVRGLISASGGVNYNSSTGNISIDSSETRALFSGGTGVTITNGSVAIGQAVATTSDVTFAKITGDSASIGQINFKTNWADSHIGFAEGAMWYDPHHKNLNFYTDVDVAIELGQQVMERVYNDTGSTISKGKPLYYSGNRTADDGRECPTVALANATDDSKYNVQGLAAEDIADGTYGMICVAGVLDDFDTSHLTAGQNFFAGLTDGATQNASPTYPNYPMCLGWVIESSVTNGKVIINQQNHSVNSFRVRTSAHIGDDLQVDGNLTVLGTQTIASSENVSIGAAFNYLNAGDTIGETNTAFTGSGLDDAYFAGHFSGTASTNFYVKIGTTGTPDQFEWGYDSASPQATGINITGGDQLLDAGISINFGATTGHTTGDKWTGTAAPTDVDTGFFSNRNTGGTGVGYTHVGMFYDVSASRWRLVDEYYPEPSGSIDITDSSFSAGILVVDTLEGNVTGNVTGTVSGNAGSATILQNSRNFSITGDVTASAVSFNGSGNVTLTATIDSDGINHLKTDDLPEGSTNLYYTDTRARNALNVGGDLTYDSASGQLTFTQRTDAQVRGLISAGGDLSYNSGTGVMSFTERTDAEVRGLVSAGGDLSYNSGTGVFSFSETYSTANELLTAIKTVDGATSGLDADLLDGQHGSYYRINVYNSSGTLLN